MLLFIDDEFVTTLASEWLKSISSVLLLLLFVNEIFAMMVVFERFKSTITSGLLLLFVDGAFVVIVVLEWSKTIISESLLLVIVLFVEEIFKGDVSKGVVLDVFVFVFVFVFVEIMGSNLSLFDPSENNLRDGDADGLNKLEGLADGLDEEVNDGETDFETEGASDGNEEVVGIYVGLDEGTLLIIKSFASP